VHGTSLQDSRAWLIQSVVISKVPVATSLEGTYSISYGSSLEGPVDCSFEWRSSHLPIKDQRSISVRTLFFVSEGFPVGGSPIMTLTTACRMFILEYETKII
jgi:hypothetical protein